MLTLRAISNSTDVLILCSFVLEGSMRKALSVSKTFMILILVTNWTLWFIFYCNIFGVIVGSCILVMKMRGERSIKNKNFW